MNMKGRPPGITNSKISWKNIKVYFEYYDDRGKHKTYFDGLEFSLLTKTKEINFMKSILKEIYIGCVKEEIIKNLITKIKQMIKDNKRSSSFHINTHNKKIEVKIIGDIVIQKTEMDDDGNIIPKIITYTDEQIDTHSNLLAAVAEHTVEVKIHQNGNVKLDLGVNPTEQYEQYEKCIEKFQKENRGDLFQEPTPQPTQEPQSIFQSILESLFSHDNEEISKTAQKLSDLLSNESKSSIQRKKDFLLNFIANM